MTGDPLLTLRRERWCQTQDTRIPDPTAATHFIERVGIATLFPVSPEVPNLFHAYVGDSEARTDSGWDSPSGHVFGWRWDLGRKESAFYATLVRNRPTWVSWNLLPAILRLRGEMRTPDELYDVGEISLDAYRIVQALETSGGVLSTGELRRQAGFPTGKPQRAAYLKAVDELDRRLLLAKVFSSTEHDMYHALVSSRYPAQVETAERLTRDRALDQLLRAYLPPAVYAAPGPLAKHLGVPEPDLHNALNHLVESGQAARQELPGRKAPSFIWSDARQP